jgi:hypothetical protein
VSITAASNHTRPLPVWKDNSVVCDESLPTRSGISTSIIDIELAIGYRKEFSRVRFYQNLSFAVFEERMCEDKFKSKLKSKEKPGDSMFFLFDELQCILADDYIEFIMRDFCKILWDTLGWCWNVTTEGTGVEKAKCQRTQPRF